MSGRSPLRVVQLAAPTGYYGAERWIVALTRHLSENEINSDLVTIGDDLNHISELVDAWPLTAESVVAISEYGRFDPTVILKLSKLFRQRRVDIVHSHGYKSDILGLLAARISGSKLVITPHGFGSNTTNSVSRYIKVALRLSRYADAVVPLSSTLADIYQSSGVTSKRLHLIPNAVDLNEVKKNANGAEWVFPAGSDRTLIYIGRLVEGKQVDHLIKAADLVRKRIPELKVLIVGEGPQLEQLEMLVGQLNLSDSVRFLGFRGDRLELLARSSAFVLPSKSEGTPRAMMEAMGMKVPCVAYDIDGVKTLAQNRISALLAPSFNIEALADCCYEILSNKSLAVRIGLAGEKTVVEGFSGERLARDYLELYKHVVKNANAY